MERQVLELSADDGSCSEFLEASNYFDASTFGHVVSSFLECVLNDPIIDEGDRDILVIEVFGYDRPFALDGALTVLNHEGSNTSCTIGIQGTTAFNAVSSAFGNVQEELSDTP